MTLRRHLVVLGAVLLAATAAPRPARAGGGDAACGALLQFLYYLPPPTYERPLALEILAGTDFQLGTGTVLSTQPPEVRVGTELRLAVGLPATGYELLLDGGWLAPVLGSRGALRAGLGFDAAWDMGGPSFYVLATDGVFASADGLGVPGGLAVLPEWRVGMGLRVPVAGGAIVAEWDTSVLGWAGEAGGPIFGLRLGYAFGGSAARSCIGPTGLPTGPRCRPR